MIPRIALISTPWPFFNRPSIQLGTLKAFLHRHSPEVKLDAHHLYLNVAESLGYDLYSRISKRTWLSEPLYAALLYPEMRGRIRRFWQRHSAGLPFSRDFGQILERLQETTERLLHGKDWQAYGLAGFTICFGQMTSTLYFIHRIKESAPSLMVVVGGPACAGELGRSLLHAHPEIDFAVSGEGELPLLHLGRWLSESSGKGEPEIIPGLLLRGREAHNKGRSSQVPGLDDLPVPDYRDYFVDLRLLSPGRRFIPKLPMEISRGCWWRRGTAGGKGKGCAFCNLNLQWKGYRAKTRQRVVRELEELVETYQVLSISFMDNLLPAADIEGLFRGIAHQGRDLSLFAEIRATTSREELAAMGRAGMGEVQVGIEALSNSLLKKINKGTTVADNLEIMKNCEASGMPRLTSNLILGFPGSGLTEVEETLATLDFVLPFRPLKGLPFWLGYGSPVWQDPGAYLIKRVRNHPYYAHFIPPGILKELVLTLQGYQGGVRRQQRLWRRVKNKIDRWREAYFRLHEARGSDPILSYQDGRHFMIIRQRRHGADDMTHRLTGSSRKIYLFCERSRFLPEILDRFPGFGEEKIMPFLLDFGHFGGRKGPGAFGVGEVWRPGLPRIGSGAFF